MTDCQTLPAGSSNSVFLFDNDGTTHARFEGSAAWHNILLTAVATEGALIEVPIFSTVQGFVFLSVLHFKKKKEKTCKCSIN